MAKRSLELSAEHPLHPLARHRALRAALRVPGADPEHPDAGRPGSAASARPSAPRRPAPGSRASPLTGLYCHNNGMLGLAHRGWKLNDYGQHWVHALRRAGYRSTMIGEQHISVDPGVIGYDEIIEVDSNHAENVAPLTIDHLRHAGEDPWFMSVGFFETHRDFAPPASVRRHALLAAARQPARRPRGAADVAAFKASARSLDHGIGAVLARPRTTSAWSRTPWSSAPPTTASPSRTRRRPCSTAGSG